MSVWTHITVTFTVDNRRNTDPEHIKEVLLKTSPSGSEGGLWGGYFRHGSMASGGYGMLMPSTKWKEYDECVVKSDPQLLLAFFGDFRDFGKEEEKSLNDWFERVSKWIERTGMLRMSTLTYNCYDNDKVVQRSLGWEGCEDWLEISKRPLDEPIKDFNKKKAKAKKGGKNG